MSRKVPPKTMGQLLTQVEMKTEQMNSFILLSKFTEAKNCKQEINKIKHDIQMLELQELEDGYRKRSIWLQNEHEKQMQAFHRHWNKKIEYAQLEGYEMKQKMHEANQAEFEELRQKQQEQMQYAIKSREGVRVKQSFQLSNLRKMMQVAIKKQNFTDAEKMSKRIQTLEMEEQQVEIQNWNLKIEISLNQLYQRHEGEMLLLAKKRQQIMNQQLKLRSLEEKRLEDKYKNSLRQLRAQQENSVFEYRKKMLKENSDLEMSRNRNKRAYQ